MKIRFLSDFHSEFYAKDMHKIHKIVEKNILLPLPEDSETTLILSGDIGSMHKPKCLEAFLNCVADRFYEVLYIPGNHEPYGGDINTYTEIIEGMASNYKNVTFGDMMTSYYPLSDITIVGCTLWTDMGFRGRSGEWEHESRHAETMYACGSRMNDYRLIGNGEKRPLTIEDTLNINNRHAQYIKEKAVEGGIVFTHHAPSFKSVNEKYVGDIMTGAYANNLDEFILQRKPKVWIHGHMHDPVDYMIGDTRVISNPVGYPGEYGISGYRKDLVIDV